MREVISFDKDYVNGIEKQYKTNKPECQAIGKVTVSLHDENNKKIREIYTENAIMDRIKYDGYLRPLYLAQPEATTSNYSCVMTDMVKSLYVLRIADDYTPKSTYPLIPYEKYNYLGFCGFTETYSGDSTTKGTYNTAESKRYVDAEGNLVHHYVYDFPTHACNGTINAIGYVGSSSPCYGPVYSETTSALSKVSRARVANVFEENNRTYVIQPTKNGFSLGVNATYLYNYTPTTTEVVLTGANTYTCYRFNTKNKNIVAVTPQTDKTTMSVKKLNLEGRELETKTITLGEALLNAPTYVKAYFDDEEEYLYVIDNTYLKVFDAKNNYSLVHKMTYIYDGDVMSWNEGYNTMNITKNFIYITYNGTRSGSSIYRQRKILRKDYSYVNSRYTNSYGNITIGERIAYNNHDYVYSNDYTYGYHEGLELVTLTKLPNEITKTNLHTMKIQYDIIFKPINRYEAFYNTDED